MTKIYGHKGDAEQIEVEPTIAGDDTVPPGRYPAVRIDDPAVQHVYVLEPFSARQQANRVRENADGSNEMVSRVFAESLELACDEALELAEEEGLR